jgi:hypothetical protein
MGTLRSRQFLLLLAAVLLAAGSRARADLPPDWTSVDINATGGSADLSADGFWTVTGSGADIWNQADEFQYVYRFLDGDGSVTTRILSQTTRSDGWAKAGVMLRDSESPGSPHMMIVMTPGAGVDMQWRPEQDAGSLDVGANSYARRFPLFLRVQRKGDLFSAFVSEDALTWIQIGTTQKIRMGKEILAGLCVTSHNKNALCTARFERTVVSDDLVPTGPATLQALVRDGAALVVWDSVSGASGYHVYRRGPGTTGPQVRVTRAPVDGLSFVDAGLTNGAVYRYQVTAVIKGRESTPSDVAAVTPMAPIQVAFYGYTIGTTTAGSAVQEVDGSITVKGSGWDIWDRQDGFYFLAQPVDGDAVVTVHVLGSPSQTDPWAKAGVMIRESLASDARHAMLVVTPRNGFAFQRRLVTGGISDNDSGGTPSYPLYLRLVRRGDWITPYVSGDGVFFAAAGQALHFNLLNREMWIGLAATAHRDRALSTTHFDQLTISAP